MMPCVNQLASVIINETTCYMENGMHLLKASTWIRHLEKRERERERGNE